MIKYRNRFLFSSIFSLLIQIQFHIFLKLCLIFLARAVVKFNLVKIQQKDVENVKIFCHKINWTIF